MFSIQDSWSETCRRRFGQHKPAYLLFFPSRDLSIPCSSRSAWRTDFKWLGQRELKPCRVWWRVRGCGHGSLVARAGTSGPFAQGGAAILVMVSRARGQRGRVCLGRICAAASLPGLGFNQPAVTRPHRMVLVGKDLQGRRAQASPNRATATAQPRPRAPQPERDASKSGVGNKGGTERCSLRTPFASQNFGVVGLSIPAATQVYLQQSQSDGRFIFWITSKPGLGRRVNSVELKRQWFQSTGMWISRSEAAVKPQRTDTFPWGRAAAMKGRGEPGALLCSGACSQRAHPRCQPLLKHLDVNLCALTVLNAHLSSLQLWELIR